jgi:hypothetical protein
MNGGKFMQTDQPTSNRFVGLALGGDQAKVAEADRPPTWAKFQLLAVVV